VKRRYWLWYALAWTPLAVYYAFLMRSPRTTFVRPPPSLPQSLIEGATYVAPVALLGVGVWWLAGRATWPPKSVPRFVALHLIAAVAFTFIWLAAQVAFIAMGTGVTTALTIAKTFAGFQVIEGFFVYGLLTFGSHAVRIAHRLRQEEARVAQADAARATAELSALRGQLNPHFLFNTLHTLTALVRRDPITAEHALEQYGDMLRYVLDVKRSAREDVPLGDELQFVRDYLALEQLRLGDRLRITETVDPESLDCIVPSLTLQPLVENAIKHAVAPRSAGGTIAIEAKLEGNRLVMEVRDDGPGADLAALDHAEGMGLRAVRQRIRTRYDEAARFVVTTTPGEGFSVRVEIPVREGLL
jgi:signal transduction histidine kinase